MIAIGSDHGGFKLKEKLKEVYTNLEFKDFGTFSEDSMDFPDVGIPLAESVACGECEKGILICRTGVGMSIAANKVPGVRCALCYSETSSRLAKQHNDVNVIAIGADELEFDKIQKIIDAWLDSEFLGGKYAVRVEKIRKYEESKR